ncbi:uncharacterized protein A1O9_06930 [Exophiala aquamarina CBS 119918]|uniref:Cyclase n=1 Tax=Exophiala aquamarina CBS 119918 TaxID=1182545 RepID=A0A072PMJ6_9EURO|nr:uncharacterized protein A1O9_06930 [Exophiala aquamarina CBS 119918]KEF56740.1 hypothetical protein A1O9_06930 [Exophiala aquamarina CBS 119918]
MSPVEPSRLPLFSDLPLHESHPPHSAWGVWDHDDQLGCLNHLTPNVVLDAAREIRAGETVGLSWELNQMRIPPWYRIKLEHKMISLADCINDDELRFNTQTGSQWDGFRHWCFPDGRFYNGVTQTEVRSGKSTRLGIHGKIYPNSCGIVGRGVLIDYYSFAQARGIDYDPLTFHKIPLSTIIDIAKETNVEFRRGDILFLRTGYIKRYLNTADEELEVVMKSPATRYPGMEGSLDALEWLWDSRFAAVAGDCPGFEAWFGESAGQEFFRMHETLLSGFGMPIGELFDLEELSKKCAQHSRWTFFVTSQPLNVVGGVGSPPNAIAIF